MVREFRVLIDGSSSGDADFGSGYLVTACKVGAQVSSASSGQTVNVRAGHGFAAGDKMIVGTGAASLNRYREVVSVTSLTVVISESVSVATGEYLVNLGPDTGTTGPNYDGEGAVIYSDMGYVNQISGSTVAADAVGRYRYFHKGIPRWELVRTSGGTPYALYLDAGGLAEEDPVAYGVRYAHLFATSGDGTVADPWVTNGSNPVQAAVDDLPVNGGVVHMVAGYYDLGSNTVAVTIPVLTSGLDRRQYVFRGDGRDLVFLNYTGTGSAFRYPQTAVGPLPETGSWQSNQLIFEDFAVCQAGTDFAGNAFWMSYLNESLFHRLTIGTPRVEGGSAASSAEPGYGFQYGIRLEGSVVGQNVVDFNRIDQCLINGNTKGIYMENQADNCVVTRCWFQPDIANTAECNGIEVHNSNAYVIQGNHFNYYGRGALASTSHAIKLSGYARGASVIGNYFEWNPISIWLYNDEDQGGIDITGNMISFTGITNAFGIYAGILAGSFETTGLNISANCFVTLSATNTAIKIFDTVTDFTIQSNRYENTGGTNRTIQVGARGVIRESNDPATNYPFITLIDSAQYQGRIYLENTSTSAEESPRVQFKPGGSGSRPSMSVSATAAGAFQFIDDAGAAQAAITQTGNLTRRVATVTASTTQTQVGGTALTADINNVSVCANANDTVTLPTAVAGMSIVIMNNGAQTLKIYPASGDNLGAGVDTSTTLAAGSNVRYTSYDATNWEAI